MEQRVTMESPIAPALRSHITRMRVPPLRHSPERTIERVLLHVLPALLLTAALWVPFGFSLGAMIEEWGILEYFVLRGPQYWISPSAPMAVHSMRPLTILPHAIAYWLLTYEAPTY